VSDLPNRCLSSATAALYGVTEAAVLAAGYAPAVGFIHTGKPLSFVYDIADIYKFETVVPAAFKVAANPPPNPERAVRLTCRTCSARPACSIESSPISRRFSRPGRFSAPRHLPTPWALPFRIPESMGDAGHRS
jgi:CRISPR-associated protein Cas1